jgi:hypothetical protein
MVLPIGYNPDPKYSRGKIRLAQLIDPSAQCLQEDCFLGRPSHLRVCKALASHDFFADIF